MSAFIDMSGQVYGRLTVIAPAKMGNGRTGWLCRCWCGKETTFLGSALRTGNNKSCGCLHRSGLAPGNRFGSLVVIQEVAPEQWGRYKKRIALCRCDCGQETTTRLEYLRSGHTSTCGCQRAEIVRGLNTTHGGSGTRLHKTWHGMKERCFNPNTKSYQYYGAKGVTVAPEWLGFAAFRDWALANGYRDDLTIERKNPFGIYEPGNCCWIPKSEQRYNRRDTVRIAR